MAAITGMGAILLASGPIACQSYIERIAQAMHAVRSGGDRPSGSRLGAACSGWTLSVQLRQNPVFAPCTMSIVRSALLLGICSTDWATSRKHERSEGTLEAKHICLLGQAFCSPLKCRSSMGLLPGAAHLWQAVLNWGDHPSQQAPGICLRASGTPHKHATPNSICHIQALHA